MRRFDLPTVPLLAAVLMLAAPSALAAEDDPDRPDRPSEDAMFGGADDDPDRPSDDAIFGGPEDDGAGGAAEKPETPPIPGFDDRAFDAVNPFVSDAENDPLAIGGRAYMRLMSSWTGDLGDADDTLRMPNLLDIYLDARPDPRVRAFFSGRLSYDPTITPGALDALGEPADRTSVAVNQLWIKTDIARRVFLTFGQQAIKWGTTYIWNPTDFINARKRNPLDFIDDRLGVTMLKVHMPFESLGWNLYAFALLDDLESAEDVAGAARLEMVFGTAELGLSALAGKERRTSFGLDLSAGIWELDIVGEVALTDEDAAAYGYRDLAVASASQFGSTPEEVTALFDLLEGSGVILPSINRRAAWYVRASGGIQWTFKPNDDDIMTVGAEYFFNPLGFDDPDLYMVALAGGIGQPLYLGRHYAAAYWLVPAPGNWDEATFTTSTLANLSDPGFISRLDFSLAVHTRLQFEAFVMLHYGKRGGEARLEFDLGELDPAFADLPFETIRPPLVEAGINLRVSI